MSTLNQSRQDSFARRMTTMMNEAALSLMISIGHQTDLFETMAQMPPASSDDIASAAGLNERYVREWLAAMTTGRIVDYDPDTSLYHLPPEHAASLTRAAGSGNFGQASRYIGLLGLVEEGIIQCFRNGGGVPYSHYPQFQAIMAEGSAQLLDTSLVDFVLPVVPGLVDDLEKGAKVLDLGCGQGHAVNLMAEAFPNSLFWGYDFSEESIAVGQAESQSLGLSNTRFVAKDVTHLGESDRYDLITAFDAIHDQAEPATVLSGINKALKPGGTFLMMDVGASSNLHENMDHQFGPWLYTISTMHCMSVSLALNGAGLGTMWGEQLATKMLAEAGFGNITVERLDHDAFNYYYIANKT